MKPEQEAKLRIYPMGIEPRADLPIDMKEIYHFGNIDKERDVIEIWQTK